MQSITVNIPHNYYESLTNSRYADLKYQLKNHNLEDKDEIALYNKVINLVDSIRINYRIPIVTVNISIDLYHWLTDELYTLRKGIELLGPNLPTFGEISHGTRIIEHFSK